MFTFVFEVQSLPEESQAGPESEPVLLGDELVVYFHHLDPVLSRLVINGLERAQHFQGSQIPLLVCKSLK